MKTKFLPFMSFMYSVFMFSCMLNSTEIPAVEEKAQPVGATSSLPTESISEMPTVEEEAQPISTTSSLPKIESISIDSLNSTPPEDILKEVSFFGGGGGDLKYCPPISKPEICEADTDVNWPEGFWIHSHSWNENETVTTTIIYPDLSQKVIVGQAYSSLERIENAGEAVWLQNYRISYFFPPSSENMLGEYTIKFDGTSGHIKLNVFVKISSQPHMSILDSSTLSSENKIILTGFAPNEEFRLFAYVINDAASIERVIRSLFGWNSYTVDKNGMLIIDTSKYSEYSPLYYVVRENSELLMGANTETLDSVGSEESILIKP